MVGNSVDMMDGLLVERKVDQMGDKSVDWLVV